LNAAALTVLLGSLLPGQAPAAANLDFSSGTLAGWSGQGFALTTANHRGPSMSLGVCSSDRGKRGRTASLRYTFRVPPGMGLLRCCAYASCRPGLRPDERLDVLLLTEDSQVVPKLVRGPDGWQRAEGLLSRLDGKARDYCWEIERLAGRRVQVVLLDQDDRAGCHLFCSGFRLSGAGEFREPDFEAQMKRLERDHGLPPLGRFGTRHFTSWSNADADFTRARLRNCEVLYQLFFEHFRRRGFAVQTPSSRLLVAVFDSQAGFEAYLGMRMPSAVTGVYNRATNQLALYDLTQNDALVANRQKALQDSRAIPRDLDRIRFLETVHRHISEVSLDGGLSTAMHETAHHLSFNCGLLNRHGDVPVWLCEGLACYCEATEQGGWQGLGEPNAARIRGLAGVVRGRGRFLSLRALVENDDWRQDSGTALVGYSHSWALFRMLIQQQPAALRRYLEMIYDRRTPDHRLLDFCEVFGADLGRLERHYHDYMAALVQRHASQR
jgi:hypothetical protein